MESKNLTDTKSVVRFSKFISGELIDLCVPNELAIVEDDWTDWFNDVENLSTTQHGIFPNSRSAQLDLLKSLDGDRSKILLLVCDKKSNTAIGVVSLSNIDFSQGSAEIAINMSSLGADYTSPLASLESMALITQHGFDQLGLKRIYGGQVYPDLASWNKYLELIGYKSEGITRNSFVRGQSVKDTVLISCQYRHYLKLKEIRGSLWGCSRDVRRLMRKQPEKSFANQLNENYVALEADYFNFLFQE